MSRRIHKRTLSKARSRVAELDKAFSLGAFSYRFMHPDSARVALQTLVENGELVSIPNMSGFPMFCRRELLLRWSRENT